MSEHRHLREAAKAQHSRRINEICRAHGGVAEADDKADKALVAKGIHQHDAQLHPGRKTRLHLRDGGAADGGPGRKRLDRAPRRRRADGGGSADGTAVSEMQRAIDAGLAQRLNPAPQNRADGGPGRRGGRGKAGHVNVIVAAGGRDRPVPVPVPAMPGAGGLPPRPPMAPAVTGGMMPLAAGIGAASLARPPVPGIAGAGIPGMGAPGAPGMPPLRSRGGRARTAVPADVGSHSALGRLAKAKLRLGHANAAEE